AAHAPLIQRFAPPSPTRGEGRLSRRNYTMPKVLISDDLSPAAVEIFRNRGVDVEVKTGLKKEELLKIIDQYDGLAVRSATKADKDVIAAAKNLKVVGRAGIGVD